MELCTTTYLLAFLVILVNPICRLLVVDGQQMQLRRGVCLPENFNTAAFRRRYVYSINVLRKERQGISVFGLTDD